MVIYFFHKIFYCCALCTIMRGSREPLAVAVTFESITAQIIASALIWILNLHSSKR
jgi:hypothetical protein